MVANVAQPAVSHWYQLNSSKSSCSLGSWSRHSFRIVVQDRIHTDASCICCSQGWKRSLWSGLCTSSPSPLHRLATQHFDEHYTQRVSNFWANLHFNFWVFTFGCFSLKAVYSSCKLERLLQVTKFLFMYSFTHTNFSSQTPNCWNCHLHKRLLPDEVFN